MRVDNPPTTFGEAEIDPGITPTPLSAGAEELQCHLKEQLMRVQ